MEKATFIPLPHIHVRVELVGCDTVHAVVVSANKCNECKQNGSSPSCQKQIHWLTSAPNTTKGMDRWDIRSNGFQAFISFLQSDEGKRRQQSEAEAIATDVAKYLAFCSASVLRWNYLWELAEVRRFLACLKKHGIGVDGRLTKLDRLTTALAYIKLDVVDDTDYMLLGKLGRALDRLSAIKATLRPKKVAKRTQQLEALSSSPLSLDEVTAVIDNPELWAHFDCTVKQCKSGSVVANNDLALTTAAMLALLTFKNWQRAGAVVHMTAEEFHEARREPVEGEELLVVMVKAHKTGIKGSAKLTLASGDAKCLVRYYRHIRPKLDPACWNDCFLLLPGGKPVEQVYQVMRKLEVFGTPVPSATRVRKIGATVSAQTLTSARDVSLIGTHMSHTLETQQEYYRANRGAVHAAESFTFMEGLRMGSTVVNLPLRQLHPQRLLHRPQRLLPRHHESKLPSLPHKRCPSPTRR